MTAIAGAGLLGVALTLGAAFKIVDPPPPPDPADEIEIARQDAHFAAARTAAAAQRDQFSARPY